MRALALVLLTLVFNMVAPDAEAASARKIDKRVQEALTELYAARPAVRSLVQGAHGVLVFPRVYKAGIGIGGEYGEGALRERGRTAGYYNLVTGSVGFQLGGQRRSIVIAFTSAKALQRFKELKGFKVGVDGSVVVADLGTGGVIDSNTAAQPVIAFVFGEKGLMYNATLEGSKITRIHKD